VAIGEEVQWRPSTAFEPKKKGKKGWGSDQARGQERRGGGLAQRVTCSTRKEGGARWSTARKDGGGGRWSVDTGARTGRGGWSGTVGWAARNNMISHLFKIIQRV
jgi:hypothetical protein